MYGPGHVCSTSWRRVKPNTMTLVGFEPTPFRNGALSHRLRPLGQSVSGKSTMLVGLVKNLAFSTRPTKRHGGRTGITFQNYRKWDGKEEKVSRRNPSSAKNLERGSLRPLVKTTPRGFEPLRAEPNGFLVHHLSHSVTLFLESIRHASWTR